MSDLGKASDACLWRKPDDRRRTATGRKQRFRDRCRPRACSRGNRLRWGSEIKEQVRRAAIRSRFLSASRPASLTLMDRPRPLAVRSGRSFPKHIGERTTEAMAGSAQKRIHPLLKLVLEIGPLVLFFLTNAYAGRFGVAESGRIFVATAVFIAATVLSLTVCYALVKKLPTMPLVSGVVIVVFGGLTLALQDELFIKLKPTIVNTLFGLILLGGLYFQKPLLALVLDSMFHLDDEGWSKLTLRWALFFFVLAALNEIVWRTQTTDFWVSFKVFGIMPLTVAFALAQTPLILRHEAKPDKESFDASL